MARCQAGRRCLTRGRSARSLALPPWRPPWAASWSSLDQVLTAGVALDQLPGTSLGRCCPGAPDTGGRWCRRLRPDQAQSHVAHGRPSPGACGSRRDERRRRPEPRRGRRAAAARRRRPVAAPGRRGAWLGGLPALLIWLRRRAPDESAAQVAWRFSRVATVSIALVVITGIVRAVEEVGTVDALLSTAFGWLVIAKSALLGRARRARRLEPFPACAARRPRHRSAQVRRPRRDRRCGGDHPDVLAPWSTSRRRRRPRAPARRNR